MNYLSIKEYAKHWSLSYSHVLRCVHNGRLPAVKVGSHTYRIAEDQPISEWVELPPPSRDYLKRLAAV